MIIICFVLVIKVSNLGSKISDRLSNKVDMDKNSKKCVSTDFYEQNLC